jgi:exosortase D (VPLPA-CTERM-specific)
MDMNPKDRVRSLLPQLLLGAIVLAVLWSYWPVLSQLIAKLARDEDYSYGLLLPLISGYIVYQKWPKIRSGSWQPAWSGIVIMALGFCLFLFGDLAAENFTTCFSFLVVLTGILWLWKGPGLVRLLAFPLLILIAMIPLPAYVMQKLTIPLQLISSQLATEFLRTIGIPAYRSGNVIDLGVRQLQVVAACSGLRYILSLLALGAIFCYFFQRRLWKVAVLMASIIPVAIFANAVRVAAMGIYPVLAEEGFWHVFSGWLIFLSCFALLALLNQLMDFLQPQLPRPEKKKTPVAAAAASRPGTQSTWYLLAGLVLVLLAAPISHHLTQVPPVPLRQSFDNFPLRLGPYSGQAVRVDPVMVEATKCDAYLNIDFKGPEHHPLNLWIAYYENQKTGGVVHSPFSCMVGGGWRVIESGLVDLGPGKSVNYLLLDQSGAQIVVYYWYIQRGRWIASESWNRIFLSFDVLVNRRNDGALVRLITPATPDAKAARARLGAFARLLSPLLPQFIPQ